MRKLIISVILISAMLSILSCTEDADSMDIQGERTLSAQLMTRSAESYQLVTVQDSTLYPFQICLSTLQEGVYQNSFVATVYVTFYHDKSTNKPFAVLNSFYAPPFYNVGSVNLSEDLCKGRYKLSASGTERNGINCSGTYPNPLFIAEKKIDENDGPITDTIPKR